jgi:multiple sugar transport system permease protein
MAVATELPVEGAHHRGKVRIGLASRQALLAYLFLTPVLIYFGIFYFYPIALEFWISLQKGMPLIGSSTFAGFGNYLDALQDKRVQHSFQITVLFALENALASVVIGMGLAMLLNQGLRGRTWLRAIIFFPYLTTIVIVALMWRNMLDPYTGILNALLSAIGLPGQNWLLSTRTALVAVMGITVWHGMGYNMLLFLAGLQGIPDVYLEAAEIDGAGSWVKFRRITLPLLAPTTLFVSVISVIGSLQAFGQAYLITGGGPAEATRFYVFHVFQVAFNQNNFGYASALAFLMFIFILVLTLIQMKLGSREIEY